MAQLMAAVAAPLETSRLVLGLRRDWRAMGQSCSPSPASIAAQRAFLCTLRRIRSVAVSLMPPTMRLVTES